MSLSTVVTLNTTASDAAVPELLITRVRRELLGARRDVFAEVPGRAGSYVFPEQPGDRRLEIEFDLLGDDFDDRRDAVRRLADWADTPAGAVRMVIDDEPDRYADAVLTGGLNVDEWLRRGSGTLEYRVSPYTYANTLSSATLNLNTSPDSDTFNAPDDIVAYPVIELTPTNGTLLTFSLTLNGDSLAWAGLVPDDATITISSITATVTEGTNVDVNLTGTYPDPADLSMSDVDGTFPLVVPDANAFALTWTGTATLVTATITWRRRFR